LAVLNIYRVKLKGGDLLWAVVHGVAYTKEEASEKALALYANLYPQVSVEKCSYLEECKFQP
jgi:hypothetical protein